MTPELDGRVAVVTGAGRGVGRAIARSLATAGAAVGLVARSELELSETAAMIAGTSGEAIVLPADVTDPAAIDRVLSRVERELGPLSVLVNNAGTCTAIGPAWEVDVEAWRRDVDTNLLGTFVCARAAVARMVGRGHGRIINLSSYAAIREAPYMSAYGCAKAAVLHFTNTLAAEARSSGVFAFAITPGTVRTSMTEHLTESAAGQAWLPEITPERWLSLERVGELAVLLASGKADALSGRFIHVLDDVADLVRRAEEIEAEDLYVLRLAREPERYPPA